MTEETTLRDELDRISGLEANAPAPITPLTVERFDGPGSVITLGIGDEVDGVIVTGPRSSITELRAEADRSITAARYRRRMAARRRRNDRIARLVMFVILAAVAAAMLAGLLTIYQQRTG